MYGEHYEKANNVYNKYLEWCEQNRFPILAKTKIYEYLKTNHGYKKPVRINGESTNGFRLLLKK